MSSDNPTGADDQQETAGFRLEFDPHWVAGFVDGEGCFSVSIHANPNARSTGGWQLQPVFHVYQHMSYRAVLEELVRFFGCGTVRPKGPESSVLTFAVQSRSDQEKVILPFFERYRLVVKDADFRRFAAIVRMMRRREHLTPAGFERAVRLAFAMNANGKQRAPNLESILAGSSETARWAQQQSLL
jgi:hypothetical protein